MVIYSCFYVKFVGWFGEGLLERVDRWMLCCCGSLRCVWIVVGSSGGSRSGGVYDFGDVGGFLVGGGVFICCGGCYDGFWRCVWRW